MTERVEILSDYNFTGCEFKLGGPTTDGSCALMENMYARDGRLYMRPGWFGATSPVSDEAIAVGWFHSSATDTDVVFTVQGGQIYYSTTTGANLSLAISTANLAAASITLNSGPQLAWCEFNGQVVFNDSVNQPWMWDGTVGGGLTELTNAPAECYGRPAVYYGKLFFIKSTGSSSPTFTIVWSEEAAANTGYETGGYNNAWDLIQTSSEPIYAILGTNSGLYYWRARSIGLIEGAVTPDFQTTGVDDDISTNVGTTSTQATRHLDGNIFFTDSYNRPFVIVGRELVPLWEQMSLPWEVRDKLPFFSGRITDQELARGWAQQGLYYDNLVIYNRATKHVMFFCHAFGESYEYDDVAIFDVATLRFQGFWTLRGAKRYTISHVAETGSDTFPVVCGLKDTARYGVLTDPFYETEQDTLISATQSYYYRRFIGPKKTWQAGRWNLTTDRLDVAMAVPNTTGATRVRLDVQVRTARTINDRVASQPTSTAVDEYLDDAAKGDATEKKMSLVPVPDEGRWAAVDVLYSYRDAAGDETEGGGSTEAGVSRIFGYDLTTFVYPGVPGQS